MFSFVREQDLDQYAPVIYIGSVKTLYKMDTLFNRTNISYTLSPNSLRLKHAGAGSDTSWGLSWRSGNYHKDFSIIVKMQGAKNNQILFLTGFSKVEVMDSTKAVTDKDHLGSVNKFSSASYRRMPQIFELVEQTEDVRFTVIISRMLYFESIL